MSGFNSSYNDEVGDMTDLGASDALSGCQRSALITACQERYDVTVSNLNSLGGELDLNFCARLTDGSLRFLRFTPGDFSQSSIEWQNAVLNQLEKHPISVQTPILLKQNDGAVMSRHDLGGGLDGTLRMTSWVPGSNLSSLGATTTQLRFHTGVIAAELVESLELLNLSANHGYEHHWMVVRSGDSIRETIDYVQDPEQHRLVKEALRRFDDVADRISKLPQSVVHQDLHDFNLLARKNSLGQFEVSGVVDFNDAVCTARVAEVAVAAVYAGLRQVDPLQAFCSVLEGYLSKRPLELIELELLYPLAVARLAVNASTWTARSQTGNAEYARARTEATWPALQKYLAVSTEDAFETFHKLSERTVRAVEL